MQIRQLRGKDAPFMFEWLLDEVVVKYLRLKSECKTLRDCETFIAEAQSEVENIHRAVVNDEDEYMGTVSLKHIRQNSAELGMSMRSSAMGKGFAIYGMKEIIDYGNRTRGINYVYWCVNPDNRRAIRFYTKNGYMRCAPPEIVIGYTDDEIKHFLWYSMRIEH